MNGHRYTRSEIQVCQGHFTRLSCCYAVDGDFCGGHGVVSYCNGTCASALDAYVDMLAANAVERPDDTTDSIALDVSSDGQSYRVVFEGSTAEARATAYRAARTATHHFTEAPDAPFSHGAFPQLAADLYPICEHGMSADLCYGPQHYCSDEEIRQGW